MQSPAGAPVAGPPRSLTGALGALLALALYGQSLRFGFVHDDRVLLEGSARLAELRSVPSALVHDLFWLADGTVRPSPYWRPWVVLSYFVDAALGRGQAWAFHLHSVLMAAAVGGVLGWRGRWPGLLAAAVFLAHPMQVEAVANITARTDLWCAAWGTLAVFSAGVPGALLTLVALGCKETALVVPFIAWLGAPAGPAGRRQWVPHALALALWAVVRTLLVSGWEVAAVDRGGPTVDSGLGAPGVWVEDLSRLVLPVGSTVARLPADPGVVQILAGVLCGALVAWALVRARPELRRELGLLVLPVVPVSGLLTSPVRYAEGFLSWPLLGLALLTLRAPRRAQIGLVAVVVGVWTPLSLLRMPDWSGPRSLWESAVEAHPDDPRAALGLARVLLEAGEHQRALELARLAAAREPDPRKAREAHTVAAQVLSKGGQLADALEHLRAATSLESLEDPGGRWARTARCVLGADLEPPAAVEPVCAAALGERPEDPDLWNAAGIVAARGGELALAAERFGEAARLDPSREELRANAERARRLAEGNE